MSIWLSTIKRAVLSLTLAAALGSGAPPAGAETLMVTDKLNRRVSLDIPCRRVVLFESYEMLPISRAWDRVAALSRHAFSNGLMLAAKPDLTGTIPVAGSPGDAGIERLLALNPDLVITWLNGNAAAEVDFWSARGLTVLAVSPETLEDIYDLMRLHGRIFAAEAQMEAAILKMAGIFKLIETRLAGLPENEIKTAYWLFNKPNNVAGAQGASRAVFDLIKVRNLAPGDSGKFIELSLEEIYRHNPDLLFIWGHSSYGPRDLIDAPRWRRVRAVENKAVYKAPAWSTFSPRLAPLALMMAAAAYPERFADINVSELIDDFYFESFGLKNSEGLIAYE